MSHRPPLPLLPLVLTLTTLGIAACGGSSSSDNASNTTNAGQSAATTNGTTSGNCSLPTATTGTADTRWNITTGAHAPDQVDTSGWLPLSIALDTLAVSSSSPCLSVTRTSDTVTSVSVNGQPAITLTRDAHGLTIRSTLATDTHIAYQLQGSGTTPITLYSDNDYQLLLSNASIASPDGPALNLQSKSTAFVQLSGASALSDSATWTARTTDDGDEMDLKSTFFAEGPLVFRGDGSLSIRATSQHALASDRHLRLTSGSLSLNATAKDGLRANHAFVMDGGTLAITTPAGKGIKVEGKEDTAQPLGFIAINDGSLTVNSYDKAISASWEAEDDAETTDTADDPDPRVTINGGTLAVTTTGPVRNDSDDPPDANAPSPEGIEGKSVVAINGGRIIINTQDDSINSGTAFEMTAGQLYAHSVLNDSIDSNGTLRLSGGVLVATSSAPRPEGALDSDSSEFVITGGTFVGIGAYNSTPTAAASTQNIVTVTNGIQPEAFAAGLWTLRDASGNAVFSFQIPFAAGYMTLSSPRIATGGAYTVVTGGTLGPTRSTFHGLAIDPTTHSGGTAGASFVVQERITPLGTPFLWHLGEAEG